LLRIVARVAVGLFVAAAALLLIGGRAINFIAIMMKELSN
jgi:hypothetical protein